MTKRGKSKSQANLNGIRRGGKTPKAPRSARRNGKRLLSECSAFDLKKAKVTRD